MAALRRMSRTSGSNFPSLLLSLPIHSSKASSLVPPGFRCRMGFTPGPRAWAICLAASDS
eukprot:3302311-Alexandrium_andersonii.AAC.1